MSLPARKSDLTIKRSSNLPSLITTQTSETGRVPNLDAHEFFTSSVGDLDSWSLPGLLVTALAAAVLGASTYVALLTQHVDVPAPVAAPVAAAVAAAPVLPAPSAPEKVETDSASHAQVEQTLANFTQGLQQLGALFPEAKLAVAQKSHKGVVIAVSESFFFSGTHIQVESSRRQFFESLRDLAAASGLRFNVAVETSVVMKDSAKDARDSYVLKAKRAFEFSKSVSGDAFLQRRVRTTIQSGSAPAADSRVALKLVVSQAP